jgi:hypothetical protein
LKPELFDKAGTQANLMPQATHLKQDDFFNEIW